MRVAGGVFSQLPVPGANPTLPPNVCAEDVQATEFRKWIHRWQRRQQRMETSVERTAEQREPSTSRGGRNVDLIVPVK